MRTETANGNTDPKDGQLGCPGPRGDPVTRTHTRARMRARAHARTHTMATRTQAYTHTYTPHAHAYTHTRARTSCSAKPCRAVDCTGQVLPSRTEPQGVGGYSAPFRCVATLELFQVPSQKGAKVKAVRSACGITRATRARRMRHDRRTRNQQRTD